MPEELYPFRGINRAAPAGLHTPGECVALQNLVPQGGSENRHWVGPHPPKTVETSQDYLSIGWQTRQQRGPLSDLSSDPDQSLNRLVGLTADGLYIIDPGLNYQEKQVWSFDTEDDTRRAQFAEVGDSLYICVTRACADVEALLELRGDVVTPFNWPPLPVFSVDDASVTADDALPGGTYIVRFAWRLDNGTQGPSSGPYEVVIDTDSELTFRVERYLEGLSPAWAQRLGGIDVLIQAPVSDDSSTLEVNAINRPAFRVGQLDIAAGSTLTWKDTRAGLTSGEQYQMGLGQHKRLAGTCYAYNKRLILGDTAYDLDRPDLRKILQWEDSVHNKDGDDYWVLMRVYVHTQDGTIQRLSEPISVDAAHHDTINARGGFFWYRDDRAAGFDLYVSQDYSGDVGAATWKRVSLPAPRAFEEAQASNLAYARVTDSIDLGTLDTGGLDVTDHSSWSDQRHAEEHADADATSNPTLSDTPHDADISVADVLISNADLSAVFVEAHLEVLIENHGDGSAEGSGSVTVEVRDSAGNILQDDTESATVQNTPPGHAEGPTLRVGVTDDNFTPAGAASVRITTTADATIGTNDSDTRVESRITVDSVSMVPTTRSGVTQLDPEVNSRLDRDANRITWSESFRPLDMPPEHVVYAGDRSDDAVMALRATGQEVSEGQFGAYPIVVFQQGSVRVLEVGGQGGPFVTGVDVLEGDAGLVSRRAITQLEGAVVAALTSGVQIFSPQPQEPPLSHPLHDKEGDFLCSLKDGAVLGTYLDSSAGRDELWVCANRRTYVFSTQHGTWSTLDRDRVDLARGKRLYGVAIDQNITVEQGDPAGTSETVTAEIVTAPMSFGPIGRMERLRTLLIERHRAPVELTWELVAIDPQAFNIGADEKRAARLPDNTIAEDLLPNASIESGTLAFDDFGTIRLSQGIGYAWFVRISAELKPGQSIDAVGAEYQARKRVRAADLFPTVSDVTSPCPPPDGSPSCPSDQRDFNAPPYWADKEDLVYKTSNNPPVWENREDLVAADSADTQNEAPYWKDQEDLEYTIPAVDKYTPPSTLGAARYLYTAEGGLARMGWPPNNLQEIADALSTGAAAVDEAAGYVFLPQADGVLRMGLNGGNQTAILSGGDAVKGVAVDPITQALYLSYAAGSTNDGLWWCNYDGTTLEQLDAAGATRAYLLACAPDGGSGGFVFGVSPDAGQIMRWSLTGGSPTVLHSSDTLAPVVAVHLQSSWLYWQEGENADVRRIWRADFDGKNQFQVLKRAGTGVRSNTSWCVLEDEERIAQVETVEDADADVQIMPHDGGTLSVLTAFLDADTGEHISVAAPVSGGTASPGPGNLQTTSTLTIDSAQIDSDLSNFPVYVNLADMPQAWWDDVSADGSDIRVFDSGGTELDREVVWIDTGAQTGEVHFKAPTVAAASDTVFTLEVGGADYTGTPAAVWSRYAMVCHYHTAPSTSASDSANGYDGTIGDAPADAAGQLGQGVEFRGPSSNDHIAHGDITELDGAADATIQVWAEDYATDTTQVIWLIEKQDGNGNTFRIFRHGTDSDLRIALDAGGTRAIANADPTLLQDGATHHVVGRWLNDALSIWIDATKQAEDSTSTTGSTDTSGGDAHTSRDGNAAYASAEDQWDGIIDEVRVAAEGFSDAWIAAEYTNQNSPTTFYTIS